MKKFRLESLRHCASPRETAVIAIAVKRAFECMNALSMLSQKHFYQPNRYTNASGKVRKKLNMNKVANTESGRTLVVVLTLLF